MNTKTKKTTIVKKRINRHSMWISCTFPTGGQFEYIVTRYSKTLKLEFSSDPKRATNIFQDWIKTNTTSYGCLFNKIEELCNTCESGIELITKMKICQDIKK